MAWYDGAAKLLGFEIKRVDPEVEAKLAPSIVPKETDDGALTVAPGGSYGVYVDMDGSIRNEAQLINKYREMSQHPETDSAIEDIINEAIVQDPELKTATLVLDNTNFSDPIKERIREEFEYILGLLKFNHFSYDIFRRWYIDGRLYYHVVIETNHPENGILDLRYVDPRKIRKVREVRRRKDNPSDINSISTIQSTREYFLYNPKGFAATSGGNAIVQSSSDGIKIAKDSILYVTSGLLDKTLTTVISYLNKAIRPLNQLRALEDAVVIYRISRAPERRIFYIDVGNLPKMKAEQYMNEMMTKFKNRLVYDQTTGETRDQRRFMTMLEDFWLPRREGGRGTEISTLPGGQNISELSDLDYFLKQLYKALNVPVGRLESNQTIQFGRGQEISRDEMKFARFITRLRLRFSDLFLQALQKQLILKNVILSDEWDANVQNVHIRWAKDSYYQEIKETEILENRLDLLERIDQFVGTMYSLKWVRRTVLRMTEDEIAAMDAEIANEIGENIQKKIARAEANLTVQEYTQKQAAQRSIQIELPAPIEDVEDAARTRRSQD